MKIAILTTKDEWFEKWAIQLACELKSAIYFHHNNIEGFDILFILGYHSIIPKDILKKNKHNIVIHESNLPQGKGWAPLFWQVLEGKNKITFTMFEAGEGIDDGDIYMKRVLRLRGDELNEELRTLQANLTISMCKEFIENYEKYKKPFAQKGKESFYPKRTPKDSKLDINKTIKEQFNLLRIVDNEKYPAYFEINNNKYILKIYKEYK